MVKLLGRAICVRPEEPKAISSKVVTPSGMIIVFNAVQPENADAPITVMFVELMDTFVRFVSPSKQEAGTVPTAQVLMSTSFRWVIP